MAHRGAYFALCCVDESSTEVVDELLTTAYAAEYSEPALVVIKSLDEMYVEPAHPPIGPLSPPFKGKDVKECCKLVREMSRRTKSNLNYEYFVILDERSTKDSTALLVESIDEEDEINSVRTAFEDVNVILLSVSAGVGSMSENREIADRQPDGVFRLHPLPSKHENYT